MTKIAAAAITTLALAFGGAAHAQQGQKGGEDSKFMRELAQANIAEVQAGKAASGKASSGEVKQFAQHMVEDHGKKLEELRALAKAKNMELPAAPAKKHQDAMKKLEQASGESFDKAYMQQMVKDHEEALKLHQQAARNASDAQVKAAAQKSIPDIRKHLDEAKRIAGSLK